MVMLRLSSAQRAATPGFAQGVERTARDFAMSGPLRRQRGMLTDLLGPLTDPMATSADYATAARGLMGID